MPVYTCPDCATKMKRAEPLPAGKKLRCPECGNVFAPAAGPAKKAAAPAAKPAAAPKRPPADDGGDIPYTMAKDEQYAADAKDRHDIAFSPIKDRFRRSARGPALVQVVKPSNILLATGVLICAMAVAGGLYSVWPMIFKV